MSVLYSPVGNGLNSNLRSNPAVSSCRLSSERLPVCTWVPRLSASDKFKDAPYVFANSPLKHPYFLPCFLSLGTQPLLIPQGRTPTAGRRGATQPPYHARLLPPLSSRERDTCSLSTQSYPLLTGVSLQESDKDHRSCTPHQVQTMCRTFFRMT